MYEANEPQCNLICQLDARDNETLEIITPECGGRMLMAAAYFTRFHRGVGKARLHQTRPTLHMLIQRRLRANEERSIKGRDRGSRQKLFCGSVLQRDDANTHTFSDRSAK